MGGLGQGVTGVISKLGSLGSSGTGILSNLGSVATGVLSKLGGVGSSLSGLLSGVGSTLGGIAGSAGSAIAGLFGSVGTTVSGLAAGAGSAEVHLLEQEHYAGGWDILRPAKELVEYSTLTSDDLEDLLNEAEKIIERWPIGDEHGTRDGTESGADVGTGAEED